ncbi:MAG TPA: hypothetical protein VNA27_01485 [Rubrobacteraceae bacterium]|nr:hypothetical protein [Rubrobacteraceae bacterium]
MENSGAYDEKPNSVATDLEAQQRELEAAGWVRSERQGKLFWRNPKSGHVYPQGAAVEQLRRSAEGADEESESDG